jgi:hypothetical protein
MIALQHMLGLHFEDLLRGQRPVVPNVIDCRVGLAVKSCESRFSGCPWGGRVWLRVAATQAWQRVRVGEVYVPVPLWLYLLLSHIFDALLLCFVIMSWALWA